MPVNPISPIETLKKINFQDLTQFLEDVNRNFAVIENSPLYKGIPGPITPAIPGNNGLRGIKFIFVDLVKFQTQFPGELTTSSQININFINTKLLTFVNKQKLLDALEVTELIDKDIVVLTNTIILSYSENASNFINTGISFNEQANLLNNIQQQIENYVIYYVSNNQTINNLSNTFESYTTYAKNYSDNNNVFITSSLISSSVFSPYLQGFNSNTGILMNTHKYYGYSDSQFPLNNDGTIIFGSVKKYYNLLMETLSTATNNTLSSDYAPGVNNIPSAIFLQDTENAGILIGYKENPNLKRFANLFKNNIHEFVIKSDSGKLSSETSNLRIHKNYLKFDKLVQFENDLEVSRDVKFFADINNDFIKTGKYVSTYIPTNTHSYNPTVEDIEIGKEGFNNGTEFSKTKIVSDLVGFKHYLNNVLVTDINGNTLKNYFIEKNILNVSKINNLTNIDLIDFGQTIQTSRDTILTAYYYNYLARKINAISNFCTGNYWRKNQFQTGEIPNLYLSNDLIVDKNVHLTNGQIITNLLQSSTTLGAQKLEILSNEINFSEYQENVFVTDTNGKLLKTYFIEQQNIPSTELNPGQFLSTLNNVPTNLITTKYYGHLASKLNNIYGILLNDYWNKASFTTFNIPSLYLQNDLIVKGNVIFKPNNLEVFKVNGTTNTVTLGTTNTETILNSKIIKLIEFNEKVLITDNTGKILDTWGLENNTIPVNELIGEILLSVNVIGIQNTIVKGSLINQLMTKINNIIDWVNINFWNKSQFLSNVIPTLLLNTKLSVGPNGVPKTLLVDGPDVTLGNITDKVLVTDNTGKILNTYQFNNAIPNSGPGTGNNSDVSVVADFYTKTIVQPFLNVVASGLHVLNGIHFDYIFKHIKALRTLMYDRPTYAETIDYIGKGMPIGSLIHWDKKLNSLIDSNLLTNDGTPIGWVICDGRLIPGTTIQTNNYIDHFIKGNLIPGTPGGNTNSQYKLLSSDLAPHDHPNSYVFKGNYGTEGSTGNNPTVHNETGSSRLILEQLGLNQELSTQTSFSVEPASITAIPILKYWNGIGVAPQPLFAAITTINKISGVTHIEGWITFILYSDTTTIQVETSIDSGITWNVNVSATGISSPLYGIELGFISGVVTQVRLKALNGTQVNNYSNVMTIQL